MDMTKLALLLAVAGALPGFGQSFQAETVRNPAAAGAVQPNWSAAPDGSPVLSWIEPSQDGSYSLRYAVRHGSSWSAARTVTAGRHFFRHPAESPEVIPLSDKLWLAHWVEMPNESSDAEFVYVSSSTDGLHWTAPLMAHKDRSPVQHGLVSMVGSGAGEASLFWLETPKGEDGPGYLMRTVVDSSGKELREERLDADVCSCCPTAVARTDRGLLVAYRARTPKDIRDIGVIRYENGRWSPLKIVHADNWLLNACPTNAASVSAKGSRAVIAWYTGAQNSPRVEAVFSADAGSTFTKPILVSTGHAYGYTSAVLEEDGGAVVSWLEQAPDNSSRVLVRRINAAGVPGPVLLVAQGGRMALGYPRLFHSASGTFIAWGNPSQPGVETAQLKNK